MNPFLLMGGGSAIIGGFVALMGIGLLADLGAPAIVWAPVLFAVGFASAGVLIASPTIVQLETPPELMGRVDTSMGVLPTACQLFAPLVGAALAAWKSVGFVFTVAGAALAAVGIVVLILRPPVGIGVPGGVKAADVAGRPGAGRSARSLDRSDDEGGSSLKRSLLGPGARFQTTARGRALCLDRNQGSGRNHERGGTNMADVSVLKESGMDIDSLPAEQKEALGKLDQSELDALASIRKKLNDDDSDVSGYAMSRAGDGGLIW